MSLRTCLLLLPLFLLAACDRDEGDSIDAKSFLYNDFTMPVCEELPANECEAVIRDYNQHQDVRYASPVRKITMLDIACYAGDIKLAETLLRKGADPNAEDKDGQRPLYFALLPTNKKTSEGLTEPLFLTLVRQGATIGTRDTPASFTAAAMLFYKEALPWLIANGSPLSTARGNALHYLCASGVYLNDSWERTIDLLLGTGMDINAKNGEGCTPLFLYCRCIFEQGMLEGDAAAVSYLLSKGADADLPCSGGGYYQGIRACDLIAAVPALEAALKAEGVALPTYTPEIRAGEMTETDIRRAVLHRNSLTAEQLQPAIGLLEQSIDHPTDADREPAEALELLALADKQRAIDKASQMPIFLHPTDGDEECARNVISVLRSDPDLILPKELLLRSGEVLLKAGLSFRAAAVMELLARCPGGEEELKKMAEGDNLYTRVAAESALLQSDGLPCGKERGVEDWMDTLSTTPQTLPDEVLHAIYLTSLQRFLDGEMTGTVKETFYKVLAEDGLDELATQCRRYESDTLSETQLNELILSITELRWQLEDKADAYIRRHADTFREFSASADTTTP